MNYTEFLTRRKNYICGSDIASILNLNPWSSPLGVYIDKTTNEVDTTTSEPAYFGQILENVVAEEYSKRTGNFVEEDGNLITHPNHKFAAANIDRWVNDKEFILECKTIDPSQSYKLGEEGTDEVPEYWLTQVAWYAAVCDVPKVDIAVLIGGNRFKIYKYERNYEFENKLLNIAADFWNKHVLAGNPPSKGSPSDFANLYPEDNGSEVEADNYINDKVEELRDLKAREKALSEEIKNLQAEIQSYMGNNSKLVDPSGSVLATWKTTKPRKSFDSKALKEDNEDLYKQYVKEGKAPRMFLIK